MIPHFADIAGRCSFSALALLGTSAPLAAETPYIGDLGTAVAAVLTFILLLLLLRKFAWKPILTQLEHREESISRSMEQAHRNKEEADHLQRLHRARLDAVENDAQEILDKARKEAAEIREEALRTARGEADRLLKYAREEIEQARKDVAEDLKQRAAELAADIAEKVLARELDEKERRRLIEDSLDEIASRGEEAPR